MFKTLPTSNKVTLLHGSRILEAKACLRALCSVVRLGDPGMHAQDMHTYAPPTSWPERPRPLACLAPAQITSLSLGKAKAQRDRIFVAAGSHVSLLCGQGGITLWLGGVISAAGARWRSGQPHEGAGGAMTLVWE